VLGEDSLGVLVGERRDAAQRHRQQRAKRHYDERRSDDDGH
jgi:hypothetical protein